VRLGSFHVQEPRLRRQPYVCWAVFDNVDVTVLETRPIVPGTDGLAAVAVLYSCLLICPLETDAG
jgi:hypothetical protein